MEKSSFKSKFVAMAIGNAMEFFDFAIFGSFADVIGSNFFPNENPETQLLQSLSFFGAAFVMRPIGGAAIGFIGDQFGRKRAVEISIALMICPSFLIGILPVFSQWGIASTLVLLFLRLLQGLAVGGEFVGALLVTLEATGDKHRGFWGASCKASGILGTTLGMTVAALLRICLTKKQLFSWGWRIPFLLSLIFGIVGIWLRSKLSAEVNESKEKSNPLLHVLRYNKRAILKIITVTAFWGVGYYGFFVWMVYFISDANLIGGDVIPYSWIIAAIMNLSLMILFPFWGFIGDSVGCFYINPEEGYIFMLKIALVSNIISIIPAFLLICTRTVPATCLGLFTFVLNMSCFGANLPAFMISQFAQFKRYSGIGLGYNLAQAMFSSTIAVISTQLVLSGNNYGKQIEKNKPSENNNNNFLIDDFWKPLNTYDSRLWPAFYIMAVSLLSLVALQFVVIDPQNSQTDKNIPQAKLLTEGSYNFLSDNEEVCLTPPTAPNEEDHFIRSRPQSI